MSEKSRSWFMALLIVGMALAGSVAIWAVPALFDQQESSPWSMLGVASAVFVIFWMIAMFLPPARGQPAQRSPDDGS